MNKVVWYENIFRKLSQNEIYLMFPIRKCNIFIHLFHLFKCYIHHAKNEFAHLYAEHCNKHKYNFTVPSGKLLYFSGILGNDFFHVYTFHISYLIILNKLLWFIISHRKLHSNHAIQDMHAITHKSSSISPITPFNLS